MIFSSEAILKRKNKVSLALDQILKGDDVVLVFAGDPLQKPGGHDQTYPYLPHPDYFWLTGIRRPHGVSAYSKAEGWIDFVQPITREEKIWEGGGEEVPGRNLASLESWLKQGKPARVFSLGHGHSQGQSHGIGSNLESGKVREEEKALVYEAFNEVRRVKDAEEIQLINTIAAMAAQGYRKLQSVIRPGLTERQIQIEYETEVFKAGAEKMPYGTIVGTGTNSAILHATPSGRVVKENEHILIDAGADLHDYCVDITRIFPASGRIGEFSQRQKMIYDIVRSAQEKSIQLCRPGVDWKDVHLCSARVIAEGLRGLGILKIAPEEALETGVAGVFFPHGVGHMVGLHVRDVGGPPNPNPKRYGGARLRVDMPMKSGYLMTVEPGLYFIPTLLDDEETRKNYQDQINWTEVEKWKDFGGVRLEDDILITEDGPKNLTSMVEK